MSVESDPVEGRMSIFVPLVQAVLHPVLFEKVLHLSKVPEREKPDQVSFVGVLLAIRRTLKIFPYKML